MEVSPGTYRVGVDLKNYLQISPGGWGGGTGRYVIKTLQIPMGTQVWIIPIEVSPCICKFIKVGLGSTSRYLRVGEWGYR